MTYECEECGCHMGDDHAWNVDDRDMHGLKQRIANGEPVKWVIGDARCAYRVCEDCVRDWSGELRDYAKEVSA